MNNLLELGKNIVKDMTETYKDCFYEYVKADSLDEGTYIRIGKELFDNKELFLDYMNHLYVEDFNWHESEVNSFDFIQDLVDVQIHESGKYSWYNKNEQFVPVIQYSESLKSMYKDKLPVPCCVRSLILDKEIYIEGYEDYNKGYTILLEDGETLLFLEDEIDALYDYIKSKLAVSTKEVNGLLNIYLEINQKVWEAEADSEYMKNKVTNEKENIRDLFEKCMDELIENNPDTLEKYGLNQILLNVHEVNLQEV